MRMVDEKLNVLKNSMSTDEKNNKKQIMIIIFTCIIVSFLIGVFGNTLYMTFGV